MGTPPSVTNPILTELEEKEALRTDGRQLIDHEAPMGNCMNGKVSCSHASQAGYQPVGENKTRLILVLCEAQTNCKNM